MTNDLTAGQVTWVEQASAESGTDVTRALLELRDMSRPERYRLDRDLRVIIEAKQATEIGKPIDAMSTTIGGLLKEYESRYDRDPAFTGEVASAAQWLLPRGGLGEVSMDLGSRPRQILLHAPTYLSLRIAHWQQVSSLLGDFRQDDRL